MPKTVKQLMKKTQNNQQKHFIRGFRNLSRTRTGEDADDDDADESFVGEDETYNKYSISIKSCILLQILHPKSFC